MISRIRAARHRRKASHANGAAETDELRLEHVALREDVELVRIDLPSDEVEPLLELGLLPGCRLCPVRRSAFGDAVLMVDGGSLIAIRREMAGCLCVRRSDPAPN